ncbi:NAD(P)/FAD-dependent oxidoreductase [Pseudovibrio sp. Tun.PSC04-5.I4]|uniref:NAD(P)/FAD-dependent oxidoreductase n=1 Tax=Pseudovibrio sp. Tun.PSC04-5.I4 TaxID=1798213 RepID=UPI000885A791|nr:NAD(P)/FAD-dependent oxidoreductase [Pseudovibrio sp. Tun.PSC04-5.I4]SDR39599.1 L-2-hydroxyglutarate oxidase LhgO [Pseudovibrio sp. Tun.PSC04-5.I4]
MADVECIVIGAGVVGLSAAYELARRGREVIVLEQHEIIGSEISARNSEVVHAGIYYPKNSLKSKACVQGKEMLYSFCEEFNVPYKRVGKLIVATDESQVSMLEGIRARANANGVEDLLMLNEAQAQGFEPNLACKGALFSPSTGIVDSHTYMMALQGGLESHGGLVVVGTEVTQIETGMRPSELMGADILVEEDLEAADAGFAEDELEDLPAKEFKGEGFTIVMKDGYAITCHELVIAAGLHSNKVLSKVAGHMSRPVPKLYYAKGNYFSLAGDSPFSHLIYPVPEPGGLGIHLTVDMGGQARFGPDVEWIDEINYEVDEARGEKFYAQIRKYYPELMDGSLQSDYSGIRPKLVQAGADAADFEIWGEETHGIPGLLAYMGIESPGLTSSLALGSMGADRLIGAE